MITQSELAQMYYYYLDYLDIKFFLGGSLIVRHLLPIFRYYLVQLKFLLMAVNK